MKSIFLISPVKFMNNELKEQIDKYVLDLEQQGNKVHYPFRDTIQTQNEYGICQQNGKAIIDADEVHIWYLENSKGSAFDMGVAWASGKPIVIANAPLLKTDTKTFGNLALLWLENGSPFVSN